MFDTEDDEKTVVGGELEFKEGARVIGFPSSALTPAAYQPDSEATNVATLRGEFNTRLASLKAAGLMESESTATGEGDGVIEENENE